MSELCPVYLSSGDCLVKVLSNPRLSSFLTKLQLDVVVDSWNKDCQGQTNLCTFKPTVQEKVETPEPTQYFVDDEAIVVEEPEPTPSVLNEDTQEKIKRLSYTKNV